MNDDLIRRRELLEHLHRKVRSGDDVNIDKEILGFPAVDAVEVVRCKDCKHSHWEQEACHGKVVHYCYILKSEVHKEFFCKFGERRKE